MNYKTIGDYYYSTEPIGSGSFSVIYKGWRIIDKYPVAVKYITRNINIKYLYSEINVMKSINHINIVKLYDVIKDKTKTYLILEYCNNGNLSKYIKSNNHLHTKEYIYQIISGLEYLYKSNILHRDIKPQNILINNNIIKICDFGFAKNIENNELINTICGSPLYMAPEILKNGHYSPKSDIWSLGVIIYELLFKKHPYPSNSNTELIYNLKNNENIYIDDIDELSNLLIKMLKKDVYLRITWKNLFNSSWYTNYKKTKNICSLDNLSFNSLFSSYSSDSEILNSTIISKYPKSSKSVLIKKPPNNYDVKIYSCSAPQNLGQSYLENYINNINKDKPNKSEYKILGSSPNIEKNNILDIYDIVNKSVNTIRNLL